MSTCFHSVIDQQLIPSYIYRHNITLINMPRLFYTCLEESSVKGKSLVKAKEIGKLKPGTWILGKIFKIYNRTKNMKMEQSTEKFSLKFLNASVSKKENHYQFLF